MSCAGHVDGINTGEECRSRFSHARAHDAVATVTVSRQRRISILYSKFRPTDLNLVNLKQLNGTAILENHIALLYLSVIVIDFNSFIKVRQTPAYHNQLFMPAIFCLLC